MYTEIWEMAVLKRSTEIQAEKDENERLEKERLEWHQKILDQGKAQIKTKEEIQNLVWPIKIFPHMENLSNDEKCKIHASKGKKIVGKVTVKELKEEAFVQLGIKP